MKNEKEKVVWPHVHAQCKNTPPNTENKQQQNNNYDHEE